MEKIWYIIDGDHHFGPYEYGEIEALRLQNKIRASGKVISRDELRDRLNGIHVPPLRIISEPPAPKRNFQSKRLPSFDLNNPPLPIITKPKLKNSGRNLLTNFTSVTRYFDKQSTYVYHSRSLWPWLHAFLCLSLGIISWQNVDFQTVRSFPKKPASMELREYQQALGVMKSSLQNWNFSIIQSKDFKTAWLAGNYPGEAQIILTLESIDKQVLSKDKISAYTEVNLDQGLAKIGQEDWTFVSGEKMRPGVYNATIQIKELNSDWEQKWTTRHMPKTRVINFKTVWGTYSEKKIQKDLAKYWKPAPLVVKELAAPSTQTLTQPSSNQETTTIKEQPKVKNPMATKVKASSTHYPAETLAELKEQFRLLISIAGQIRSWSLEIPFLSEKELDKKMKNWLQIYQKQFGALFTGLALDNAEKEKDYAGYREISSLTQKMGKRSMDFFADAKSWKKSKKDKKNAAFAKDFQKMIDRAESSLNELESSSPATAEAKENYDSTYESDDQIKR
ncbi:MAG: hypothetical protein QE271_01995 [Bacteriovoracaceae bacterium]|nr:hypothetical protein [Bacteriovoracaceae bacterium]